MISIHFCISLVCFLNWSEKKQFTLLKTVVILLEAALVAFIAIDHHWEKVFFTPFLGIFSFSNSVMQFHRFILSYFPLRNIYYFTCQDLPYDPTGELHSLRSFIEDNSDVCKWIGIVVVSIQVYDSVSHRGQFFHKFLLPAHKSYICFRRIYS